jgi:hypothetical protein
MYYLKPDASLSPSPHANSFIIGTAVINTHVTSFAASFGM